MNALMLFVSVSSPIEFNLPDIPAFCLPTRSVHIIVSNIHFLYVFGKMGSIYQ